MKRFARLLIGLGLAGIIVVAASSSPALGQAPPGKPTLTIDVLDVGQGDAILIRIRSPEGKAALVDAGPSNKVVRLLKARGVTSLVAGHSASGSSDTCSFVCC